MSKHYGSSSHLVPTFLVVPPAVEVSRSTFSSLRHSPPKMRSDDINVSIPSVHTQFSNTSIQMSCLTYSLGSNKTLSMSFRVGHQLHHQGLSLFSCSKTVSISAEGTTFESSSSSGIARHPDNFACAQFRLREIALPMDVQKLRAGPHAGHPHNCFPHPLDVVRYLQLEE